uniref:F-box domain-containing protein n=1 Tax=Globodera pallida TaxID=36090 RepID=A0A183CM22_GLOPA
MANNGSSNGTTFEALQLKPCARHGRCCIHRKADDATLNVLNKRNMKQQRINCSSSVSNVFLKLFGYNYMPMMSPLARMYNIGWLKVFEFICPVELGLVIALTSTDFNGIVDTHFLMRKWSLGRLRILRANDGNGAEIVNEPRLAERLPIPPQLLPANVVDFERILISYVDKSVILFLQRIRHLFDSSGVTVCVRISDNEQHSWDIVRNNIFPLVAQNLCGLSLFFISDIVNLRQRSPSILRECRNLRAIHYLGHFPHFPGADNNDASAPEALAKWLLTPRADGLPKTLYCCYSSLGIGRLRESFDNAREAASFIITFHVEAAFVVTFETVNNLSGERLSLRRQNADDNWLLVRKPIRHDEAQWAELEVEAIEWAWRARQKRIMIKFNDDEIGDMGDG